ncbi:hypothetical protein GCM10023238_32580 [Streptomyces heliomycini]
MQACQLVPFRRVAPLVGVIHVLDPQIGVQDHHGAGEPRKTASKSTVGGTGVGMAPLVPGAEMPTLGGAGCIVTSGRRRQDPARPIRPAGTRRAVVGRRVLTVGGEVDTDSLAPFLRRLLGFPAGG